MQAAEHSVIVRSAHGSREPSGLFAVEERREEAIAAGGVGELDGNGFAEDGGDGSLYECGPGEDALPAAVRPVLEETGSREGARVALRQGPPEHGVPEVTIEIGT